MCVCLCVYPCIFEFLTALFHPRVRGGGLGGSVACGAAPAPRPQTTPTLLHSQVMMVSGRVGSGRARRRMMLGLEGRREKGGWPDFLNLKFRYVSRHIYTLRRLQVTLCFFFFLNVFKLYPIPSHPIPSPPRPSAFFFFFWASRSLVSLSLSLLSLCPGVSFLVFCFRSIHLFYYFALSLSFFLSLSLRISVSSDGFAQPCSAA